MPEMIEVQIDSVRVHLTTPQRLVVLKQLNSDRYLPIWVGPYEAEAITVALQEVEMSRPLTHDLLKNVQPTLLQACDYILSKQPDLIATNPTLSTITAVQRTKDVPVFMMVSPRPDIAGLADAQGNWPANLFGTYETLEYIDTSVLLIKEILPQAKRIATTYNQSEPQSMDALERIESVCKAQGWTLIKRPVNNSNETQLVVAALLNEKPDAFFALPDNTVFSSMEVIVRACDETKVPVFTSEEGLVKRGAVAAYGADLYQWGYQSGAMAARMLKQGNAEGLSPDF